MDSQRINQVCCNWVAGWNGLWSTKGDVGVLGVRGCISLLHN